jgi:GNAT superfamily N-acetyltransferase
MKDGVTALPAGKIAAVVTYLEMRLAPEAVIAKPFEHLSLDRMERPDAAWYRTIFRAIGGNWLWFSRLLLGDDALTAIIQDPQVDVFTLQCDGPDRGMLELDRRPFPEIEIAYFGLAPELIGRGVGFWLMSEALRLAWAHNPSRVIVHTCTLDHPSALGFYQRAGFVPYQRAIEIADDPRLIGALPAGAAPHVPLIDSMRPTRSHNSKIF